jgi:hypothetical protein
MAAFGTQTRMILSLTDCRPGHENSAGLFVNSNRLLDFKAVKRLLEKERMLEQHHNSRWKLTLSPMTPHRTASPSKNAYQEKKNSEKSKKAGQIQSGVSSIGPHRQAGQAQNDRYQARNSPTHVFRASLTRLATIEIGF